VNEDVEPPPGCSDSIEHGFQLSRNGDVHRAGDRRVKFPGKRLDMRPRFLIQPGDGKVCASSVVRHANDERLLSRKNGPKSVVAH